MAYSNEQLETLHHIKFLLNRAGLHSGDIPSSQPSESSGHCSDNETKDSTTNLTYISPPPYVFSSDDVRERKNLVTRKSSAQSVVDHPRGAIIEYPATGACQNVAVAHRFHIDPSDFVNPRDNIQYSLGDVHGTKHNVPCYFLRDVTSGEPVKCKQTKISCRSIKRCNFNTTVQSTSVEQRVHTFDAEREVFMKTLGFYCAVREQGCCISIFCEKKEETNFLELDSAGQFVEISGIDPEAELERVRYPTGEQSRCDGMLVMERDGFGRPLIRCEFYNRGTHGHLLLRNLSEYDIDYLFALFNKDTALISCRERTAERRGYGPLVPCTVAVACREQKDLCPSWHRDSEGILQRGQLLNVGSCTCRFEIYEPHDLQRCPYILLICRHPHSHPPPTRSKTPESIVRIFTGLLEHLEWRLADATPRRILLDTGFMHGLRHILKWEGIRDPTLSDLHPSLSNSDHTARLINKLRFKRYPSGTGIDGAKLLFSQNDTVSQDDRYLRCVETHENSTDGEFHIVICMYKSMSYLLLQTKRPSIDTSFKRLHGWQEFEIEAWFSDFERSIVVSRAFTTSQSAEAHRILFKRIFQIVKEDTGQEVRFRHVHGSGFDTITADGHRGQALGLGLYLQDICTGRNEPCRFEIRRTLSSLTATEHLSHCYRYCFAHFTRNVSNLGSHVSNQVRSAMMSLASSEPLPDLEGTLSLIRNGGKKAADWLKDKLSSNGFAFAAIYQPASKIPVEVWRAAPTTSNGNEQGHRNINRDGTKLTLLAGIMRGLQYDSRAILSFHTFLQNGIYSRDCQFTYFRRASRAIRKKASIQQRNIASKDLEITTTYEKVLQLQRIVQTNAGGVKRVLDHPDNVEVERTQKRLRKSVDQLQKHRSRLEQLKSQGSGLVPTPDLTNITDLFDENLLRGIPEINEVLAPLAPPSPCATFTPVPASPCATLPAPASSLPLSMVFSQTQAMSNLSQTLFPSSYIPNYDYSHFNF